MFENETISLFYDKETNTFIDNDGSIVWDVFRYITPSDLYMFRKHRSSLVVPCSSIAKTICELYYPDIDEDTSTDIGDDYERIERYEKAKAHGRLV